MYFVFKSFIEYTSSYRCFECVEILINIQSVTGRCALLLSISIIIQALTSALLLNVSINIQAVTATLFLNVSINIQALLSLCF